MLSFFRCCAAFLHPRIMGRLSASLYPEKLNSQFDVATVIFPPAGKCDWPPTKILDWEALYALSTRNVRLPDGMASPD